MSVGSLSQHGLRSPLSGGRRAVGAGGFAAPALSAVAALVALGAALRCHGIGHQGFWFDEANTAQLVRFSPGKMLGGSSPGASPRRRCTTASRDVGARVRPR